MIWVDAYIAIVSLLEVAQEVHTRNMNMTIVVGRNVYIADQTLMGLAQEVHISITDMVLLVSVGIADQTLLDLAQEVHIRNMKDKKIGTSSQGPSTVLVCCFFGR